MKQFFSERNSTTVDAMDFGSCSTEGVVKVADAGFHATLKIKGFGVTVKIGKHGPHEHCHAVSKGVGMEG